jgi:hypothetical protein
VAQSLTRWVRSKDGGLPHVEALTLLYGSTIEEGMPIYEVACNLLNPNVTSTHDIDRRVQEWMDQEQRNGINNHYESGQVTNNNNNHNIHKPPIILRSYRVGTTVGMCCEALEKTQTMQGEMEHNSKIMSSFESCLKTSKTMSSTRT